MPTQGDHTMSTTQTPAPAITNPVIRTSKITPCLWFADEAEEAAEFYTGIFPNSRIAAITRYGSAGHEIHGRPAG